MNNQNEPKVNRDAFYSKFSTRSAKNLANRAGPTLTKTQVFACISKRERALMTDLQLDNWLTAEVKAGNLSVTDGRFWIRNIPVSSNDLPIL